MGRAAIGGAVRRSGGDGSAVAAAASCGAGDHGCVRGWGRARASRWGHWFSVVLVVGSRYAVG